MNSSQRFGCEPWFATIELRITFQAEFGRLPRDGTVLECGDLAPLLRTEPWLGADFARA